MGNIVELWNMLGERDADPDPDLSTAVFICSFIHSLPKCFLSLYHVLAIVLALSAGDVSLIPDLGTKIARAMGN